MKCRSRSDKGERADAVEGEDGRHGRDTHTVIHFIIIYISSAWQGEGKISKNVTHTHTLHPSHRKAVLLESVLTEISNPNPIPTQPIHL